MNDKCQVCLGLRGGVPGNENVISSIIICDYCIVPVLEGEDLQLMLRAYYGRLKWQRIPKEAK